MNFAIWDVLILVFVCRRDDKPSANQWWPNSMAHIYVIRSQWVKSYFRFDDYICNNEVSHAIKWWRNTVAESCFNDNAWEQSNSRFWLLKYSDTKYASRYLNRLILQIPQCTNSISHNAPFFSRNVYVSVTKWSIVGYLSDKETLKLCIIGPDIVTAEPPAKFQTSMSILDNLRRCKISWYVVLSDIVRPVRTSSLVHAQTTMEYMPW